MKCLMVGIDLIATERLKLYVYLSRACMPGGVGIDLIATERLKLLQIGELLLVGLIVGIDLIATERLKTSGLQLAYYYGQAEGLNLSIPIMLITFLGS
ncbi:MAG: hypothetical protein ACJ8AG_12370 [Ktedonobacteraceae bacterium]